jgi:hypothetical protein
MVYARVTMLRAVEDDRVLTRMRGPSDYHDELVDVHETIVTCAKQAILDQKMDPELDGPSPFLDAGKALQRTSAALQGRRHHEP